MSKPVKNLIVDTYKRRFEGLDSAVLVDIRGIDANSNNRMRSDLAQKQIRVSVVKNSLARRAFEKTELVPLGELLDGSSAMVYATDEDVSVVTVARELIGLAKEIDNLDFKGALMEGTVFGPDEVETLSQFPTRPEAHAQVVQIVLTPAQKLVGALLAPARKIAALVKAIEERNGGMTNDE